MTKTANLTQIGVGSVANDGTGDTLREAFIKINDNFSALYQGGQFTANVTDSKNLPGIVWQGDKNTGLYHPGTGQVGVALNGQEALLMTPSKLTWKGDEIASHVYVDAKISSVGASSGLLSLPAVDTLPTSGLFNGRLVLLNEDQQTYLCLNNTWIPYKNNIIANGPSGFEILNTFPTDNLWEGRTVLRTSDTSLYVRRGSGWIRIFKYNTPAANGISAIDVVTSLPTTGNFNGREVLFNEQAYIHNGTAWVSFGNYVSTSTTSMQVVSVAPTTGLVEGKVILLANTLNKSNANAFVYIDNKFQNLGNLIYIPPSPSSITANSVNTAALQDLSVTGPKLALLAVGNVNMAVNSVITAKIQDGAVTGVKFADNSITSLKLADGAVTSAKIGAGAVGTIELADGSITAVKIAGANVTTTKLADGAVTNEKLASSAVGTIKIADSAVTTVKIADANVTTAKIADKAITAAKLSDDAKAALAPVADQTALKLLTLEKNLYSVEATPLGRFWDLGATDEQQAYSGGALQFNLSRGNWVRSTLSYVFVAGYDGAIVTQEGNAQFKIINYTGLTLNVIVSAYFGYLVDDACAFRVLENDVVIYETPLQGGNYRPKGNAQLPRTIPPGQTYVYAAEGKVVGGSGPDFVILMRFFSTFVSFT